jgi:hypothetical protein
MRESSQINPQYFYFHPEQQHIEAIEENMCGKHKTNKKQLRENKGFVN